MATSPCPRWGPEHLLHVTKDTFFTLITGYFKRFKELPAGNLAENETQGHLDDQVAISYKSQVTANMLHV